MVLAGCVLLIVVALWVVVGHRSRICVYGYLLRPKFSVRAFARSFSTSAFLAFALFVLTIQEGAWSHRISGTIDNVEGALTGDEASRHSVARNRVQGLLYRQGRIMADRMDDIAPQRPGVTDLYFLGFAGWAGEDVFRREVGHVRDLMDRRFGIVSRSTLLINSPQTVKTTPLANSDALEWALWCYEEKMDFEEDIPCLFGNPRKSLRSVLG